MREKLKSIILVLLIMLLFLNLFLYTSYLQPREMEQRTIEITSESLSALISPISVTYRDAEGMSYKSSLGPAEMHTASRVIARSLNELMIGPHALLDEAYEKSYEANSLRFSMDLGLDVKALISLVADNPEHKSLQNLKLKGPLEEIILPLDLKTLVFRIDGLYYEVPLLSELRADVEELKATVIRSSSIKYAYSSALAEGTDVLLPVGGYLAPPTYSLRYKSEFRDPELDSLSRKVFGAGSDFLKGALTSDGTLILVYGYGDEILYVDKQGFILYKNNLSLGAKPATIRAALSSALSFIIRLNGEDHGYRLGALSYKSEEDIYSFHFTKLSMDLPLWVGPDDYDVTVEVKSGQVLSYRQSYFDLEVEEETSSAKTVDFTTRHVRSLLKRPGLSTGLDELGTLEEISLAYLKTREAVSPVILMRGDKSSMLIDYYTGEQR